MEPGLVPHTSRSGVGFTSCPSSAAFRLFHSVSAGHAASFGRTRGLEAAALPLLDSGVEANTASAAAPLSRRRRFGENWDKSDSKYLLWRLTVENGCAIVGQSTPYPEPGRVKKFGLFGMASVTNTAVKGTKQAFGDTNARRPAAFQLVGSFALLAALWSFGTLALNLVNAATVLTDLTSNQVLIKPWEPYVWELSSWVTMSPLIVAVVCGMVVCRTPMGLLEASGLFHSRNGRHMHIARRWHGRHTAWRLCDRGAGL